MATFSNSRYFKVLFFLIIYFKTLTADSNSSFCFKNFGKSSNFESQIALYGDAKVVNGGLSLQITGPLNSSAGGVIYRKPIKIYEGEPRESVSFSTYFSFSMSPKNGGGLAFVMVPTGAPSNFFEGGTIGLLAKGKLRVFAVEFDVRGSHLGINVASFVSSNVRNVSSGKMVLKSGERMQAWIDYEAGSRRLEVRLNKLGEERPVEPLLFYPIDLSRMWTEEKLSLGLSSSIWSASQNCNVYSWSFKVRPVPKWMHSEPLDPKAVERTEDRVVVQKRSDCFLRILAALIFGTGIGALGTFAVMAVWVIFGNKRPIVPEEFAEKKPVDYDYKSIKVVVVDKATENGKQYPVSCRCVTY